MVIARATIKGQVVIPVNLRKKYGIHQGSRLAILDGDGQIIIRPVAKNPIQEGLGCLNKFKGPSPLKFLLKEHRKEAKA